MIKKAYLLSVSLTLLLISLTIALNIWGEFVRSGYEEISINYEQTESEIGELNKGLYKTVSVTTQNPLYNPKKWIEIVALEGKLKSKNPVYNPQKWIDKEIDVIDLDIQARVQALNDDLDLLNAKKADIQSTKEKVESIEVTFKDYIRGILSLLVVVSAIIVILRKGSNEEGQKWAYGSVGTILGYWFGV